MIILNFFFIFHHAYFDIHLKKKKQLLHFINLPLTTTNIIII